MKYTDKNNDTLPVDCIPNVDPVTGLCTAFVFERTLAERISALNNGQDNVAWAVISFDIRHFKVFNNQNGFLAGNELLRQFGEEIQNVIGSDSVARIYADNFYALVEDSRAEQTIHVLHERMKHHGRNSAEIFAGIYTLTGEEKDSKVAMDRARLAAENVRENAYAYCGRYTVEMENALKLESYLISHVDEAITKGWIKVFYQPIVETFSGRIAAMEALSRWDDPVNGFLTPGQFIPVLENAHLLYKVDLYVLETACRTMRQRWNEDNVPIPVSINLSRHDLNLPDLHERVNAILQQYGIPHNLIHLEITESVIFSDEEAVNDHIRAFHNDGFEVWLDDFGSGYSSLNTLQNYDFDCIKIDMQFLRRENYRTHLMIRSIVDMAKRLGMLTLTEGVETQEQFDFLKSIGCFLTQGYFFSKPDTIERLKENTALVKAGVETSRERVFYRRIGKVNVLDFANPIGNTTSDRELPTAIMKLDREHSRFLYTTAKFRKFLEEVCAGPWENIAPNRITNDEKLDATLKNLADSAVISKRPAGYDFVFHNITGRMSVEFITEYLGQRAFYVRLIELEYHFHTPQARLAVMQDIYSVFWRVGEIYPDEDRFVHWYGRLRDAQKYEGLTAKRAIALYADQYIHPSERERFCRLLDPKTLHVRLAGTPERILNAFFHMGEDDGSYHWRRAVITEITDADDTRRYLVTVSRNLAGWDDVRLERTFEQENPPDDIADGYKSDGVPRPDALWRAFTTQKRLGMFWKDSQRRFVGANETFLHYYNLTLGDILGKNDEDMGWHPDPEPFKRDEERVLREGAMITEAVGECLVRGKVRKIMASKAPVYDHGKIVGLAGYFVDVTNVADLVSAYKTKDNTDSMTGLMNLHGLAAACEQEARQYEREKENFCFVTLQLLDLRKFRAAYGREMYVQLMQIVAETLKNTIPEGFALARMFGSRFGILMHCPTALMLTDVQNRISLALKQIRRVDKDTPVTLYFAIGSAWYADTEDIGEMIIRAENMMLEHKTF